MPGTVARHAAELVAGMVWNPQSSKGWEDAANSALQEAAKSVRGIRSMYCDDFQAKVENNRINEYRLRAKISFLVED